MSFNMAELDRFPGHRKEDRGARRRGGILRSTLSLPLPLFPHPYMVLPVSQSLLVQSVSALCLDYVPGVSSYVSLYEVCSAHVTCGLLLMSACKLVWVFFPVFLCLLRSSSIKYPVCFYPRLLVPGSPCSIVTVD